MCLRDGEPNECSMCLSADITQTCHSHTGEASGQRISTRGSIAPALVTPAAGESTTKPRFRRDTLHLQPRAAAVVWCISMGQLPKWPFSRGDPGFPSNTWPTRVHNPVNDILIGSSVFVGFTVVTNRYCLLYTSPSPRD